MEPTVVVEADPLCDATRGVLLGFEAMTMYALFFQCSDDPLDHAAVLRAVRRDELLSEPVTACEARIGPRVEDEPNVRPQQERLGNASERSEPRDQRLLERDHRRRCLTASRELPTEELSRVKVDDESQSLPAITASPRCDTGPSPSVH